MTSDDAFLAAIEAAPGDPTPRLVYADWLDDHDQPERAELIRIEEEMAELPVFEDRFWELKPRRNELRATAPAEWLAQLGYGTVCRPVFRHGWPDGWRERWRLTREFTERWHRRPMPDVGGRQHEIAEVERRLGRELPPSLREYVAFARDYRRPDDPNHLIFYGEHYGIEPVPGHPAVALLYGMDGEPAWAVLDADLADPDPPVTMYVYDHGWYPRDDTFDTGPPPRASEFFRGHAVGCVGGVEYPHGWGWYQARSRDRDGLVRGLTAAFGTPLQTGDSSLFEGDNILTVVSVWRGPPDIHPHPRTTLSVYAAGFVPRSRVPVVLLTHGRAADLVGGRVDPSGAYAIVAEWFPERRDDPAFRPYVPGDDDDVGGGEIPF